MTGLAGTGLTLRSAADGPAVVGASGAAVVFGGPAATEAGYAAATFLVRPPVG